MNRNLILSALLSCGLSATAMAETTGGTNKDTENSTMKPTETSVKIDETSVKLNKAGQESSGCQVGRLANALSRFSIGGYGEAVMSRNFYSQHFNRYRDPQTYKDDPSHGRFDLPHVTLNLGYDFGHGWTMGMEIEFEHGGTENAVEIDADESGEYEAETERGGEVALEQFWNFPISCVRP